VSWPFPVFEYVTTGDILNDILSGIGDAAAHMFPIIEGCALAVVDFADVFYEFGMLASAKVSQVFV
jgi:hypothetical protein